MAPFWLALAAYILNSVGVGAATLKSSSFLRQPVADSLRLGHADSAFGDADQAVTHELASSSAKLLAQKRTYEIQYGTGPPNHYVWEDNYHAMVQTRYWPISILLLAMFICAAGMGCLGYVLADYGRVGKKSVLSAGDSASGGNGCAVVEIDVPSEKADDGPVPWYVCRFGVTSEEGGHRVPWQQYAALTFWFLLLLFQASFTRLVCQLGIPHDCHPHMDPVKVVHDIHLLLCFGFVLAILTDVAQPGRWNYIFCWDGFRRCCDQGDQQEVSIAADVDTAEGKADDNTLDPQADVWTVGQSMIPSPSSAMDEDDFKGKCKVLDRESFNDVPDAVQSLNDRKTICPNGICAVFSMSRGRYVVLYCKDTKQIAETMFELDLDEEQPGEQETAQDQVAADIIRHHSMQVQDDKGLDKDRGCCLGRGCCEAEAGSEAGGAGCCRTRPWHGIIFIIVFCGTSPVFGSLDLVPFLTHFSLTTHGQANTVNETVLSCLALLAFLLVAWHVWRAIRCNVWQGFLAYIVSRGMLWGLYAAYFFAAATDEESTFHLHHYIVGFLCAVLAEFNHPVSLLLLAIGAGIMVQGISAYDADPLIYHSTGYYWRKWKFGFF